MHGRLHVHEVGRVVGAVSTKEGIDRPTTGIPLSCEATVESRGNDSVTRSPVLEELVGDQSFLMHAFRVFDKQVQLFDEVDPPSSSLEERSEFLDKDVLFFGRVGPAKQVPKR